MRKEEQGCVAAQGLTCGSARSMRTRGKQRGKALNSDLWERLLKAVARHDLTFKWVRGHAGHPENERCDQLANQAARGIDLPADEEYERINGRVGDV